MTRQHEAGEKPWEPIIDTLPVFNPFVNPAEHLGETRPVPPLEESDAGEIAPVEPGQTADQGALDPTVATGE